MKNVECEVRAVDLGEGNFRGEVWRNGREVYRTSRGGPDAEMRARAAAWAGYIARARRAVPCFVRVEGPTTKLGGAS